jgi:hypothetical protein
MNLQFLILLKDHIENDQTAALELLDREIDRQITHFDRVIFPKAVNFIDKNAKPAVNPSAVIAAIYDAYESGAGHFELGRRFTINNNPAIFNLEGA